jgi:hypothetical protein
MATTRDTSNIFSAAGTGTGVSSSWFPTKDLEKISFCLYMATTAGSGSDTLDIIIEQAPTNDATTLAASPHLIRAIPITNVLTNAIASKMTQVVGGTSLPSDTSTATTLRQQWDVKENNIDTYVRVKQVIAGTASNLGVINLRMIADRKL